MTEEIEQLPMPRYNTIYVSLQGSRIDVVARCRMAMEKAGLARDQIEQFTNEIIYSEIPTKEAFDRVIMTYFNVE
ncbi:MAG: hypothetical protein KGL39_24545 [Patescibacteria group bacterium]|nr:hypothetical protein [Patescibacteria group bacterium]